MTASEILSVIAPQFDSTANRDSFIAIATMEVNSCLFGDKANKAIALLAAHMIALNTDAARQNGETGNITSKKEGDLSVGYGNFGNAGSGDLGMTHYGRQFLSMQQSVSENIFVLNSGVDYCG